MKKVGLKLYYLGDIFMSLIFYMTPFYFDDL